MSADREIPAEKVADLIERYMGGGRPADPLGEVHGYLEAHGRADLIDKPTIGRYRVRQIRRLEKQLRESKAEFREVMPGV